MKRDHKLGTFQDWAERNATLQRVAKLLAVYEWSEDKGLITCNGKQEANPIQTLYYWECAMEGDGETVGPYTVFRPTAIERDIFGLMPRKQWYVVHEDGNGFVYGQCVNARRLAGIRSEAAQDSEEE